MKKAAKKILITAGPTQEPLDPVRYISNYSTGTIGYEIAAKGASKGFDVCLISGPVSLVPPKGARLVKVTTASQMRKETVKRSGKYDCLIMTAAVCDFRPERKKKKKIKKRKNLTLKLVKNPDILSEIGRKKDLVKIGFALETENAIKNGKNKLKEKQLDLIVVNTISKKSNPFGPRSTARYTTIDSSGNVKKLDKLTKKQMAGRVIKEAEKLLQ